MQGLRDAAPHVAARLIAPCGAAHPFAHLLARNTASVALDLQNALLDDAISYAVCPTGRVILPHLNRRAGALREFAGGLFWAMNKSDSDVAEEWHALHRDADAGSASTA
jgi:hypothetical protein